MRYIILASVIVMSVLLMNCGRKTAEKGFAVSESVEEEQPENENDLKKDSLTFATKPSSVLLTGVPAIRITTVYRVNTNRDRTTYIGSNGFHYRYEEPENDPANNWNGNLMPGLEAVYGYNLVNVSHYNVDSGVKKLFFDKPVLIRTVYYPTFDRDTLNFKPVNRTYFLVSVYDEDTNKDGFINLTDLRRFYLFGLQGDKVKGIVPPNYSVFKSEYDPGNDYMYVFAQEDSNGDGKQTEGEPIHIFWIDLNDPMKSGQMY